MSRRAERRDENEPAIVRALQAVGASVEPLPGGNGRPDLLVGWRGVTHLLEVKSPDGTVRDTQREFVRRWRGSSVHLVRTADAALRAIGVVLR